MQHDAVDVAGEMDDALTHEHLAGLGMRAESSGEIERTASVPAVDPYRLARIEPYSDEQRERRVELHLIGKRELQRDRRTQGFSRRLEHRESLVAAQLDHLAAVSLDAFARDFRERRRELRSRLIAARLRERRVTADVRDQKSKNPHARARSVQLAQILLAKSALFYRSQPSFSSSAAAARARCEFVRFHSLPSSATVRTSRSG